MSIVLGERPTNKYLWVPQCFFFSHMQSQVIGRLQYSCILQRLFGTVSSVAIRLELSSPTRARLSSVLFVVHRDSDFPHLHRRSPCSCEVRRLQKPPAQLAPRIITRGVHATGTDTIKKWYFPVSRPMPTVDFSVFLRNRQRGDGALLWGLCAKDM